MDNPVKPLLLDVMLDGRFLCQLRYAKRGFPMLLDGEVVENHRLEDLESFVYEKRPSLRGKNIKIALSNQSVKPFK